MPLTLTTDEAAFITALDAPLDQCLAEGVILPGGTPAVIPEVKGYKDLKTNDPAFGDQKALAKNIFKQTLAAMISLFKTWSGYTNITNFQSGFGIWGDGNYSNGAVRYHKDIIGNVYVKGLIRTPQNSPGAYQVMFTLPVGYRPAPGDAQIFACVTNEAFAPIQVGYDGTVLYRGTPTANTWVSLNLVFRAGG